MIEAKWMSLARHIANMHVDHPNKLYPTHQPLEPREWILTGNVQVEH